MLDIDVNSHPTNYPLSGFAQQRGRGYLALLLRNNVNIVIPFCF